jgi:hypothetical protein
MFLFDTDPWIRNPEIWIRIQKASNYGCWSETGSYLAVLWIRIRIGIRIQWGPWIRICNPDPSIIEK